MRWSRFPERGFALLELALALLAIAILAGGLALPLAAQVEMRRLEESRRRLDEAREVILAFAATHARLPCPATDASRGEESFDPAGDSSNGLCARFYDGYLPAATLGLSPLDTQGFLRDAWSDSPRNRIRYAVYGGAVNGVAQALTRTNGMQAATLPALGAASHYLYVCASGAGAGSGGCGASANQLTWRAAFVLISLGANAASDPPAGSDEAKNLDGDMSFVSRDSAQGADGFDDLVQWAPVHLVVHRLLAAGRLP
jgi:type II secretory pathway pseudopilin PulG